MWFALAWQLHSDSGQVGSVGESQEGRARFSSKHILLILGSLIAPHIRTQEEEEGKEDGRGGWRRHSASLRIKKVLTSYKSQDFNKVFQHKHRQISSVFGLSYFTSEE